jgi:hypothetical protein
MNKKQALLVVDCVLGGFVFFVVTVGILGLAFLI